MHIFLILVCKFVTVRPNNLSVLIGIVVVRVYICPNLVSLENINLDFGK